MFLNCGFSVSEHCTKRVLVSWKNRNVIFPKPARAVRSTSVDSETTGDEDATASSQESPGRESMATEWTDEKHSLYLKSMEASFVSQLRSSLDSLGRDKQKEYVSDPRTRISSGQYKVFRDGCWAKINFGRDESQLNREENSRAHFLNPWIRHFRSQHKHQTVISHDPRERAALADNSHWFHGSSSHLYRQDSVGNDSEGTDQNFVDEDVEDEKGSGKKRMKASPATSSNDQVVPLAKFATTEDVAECRAYPRN